MNLSYQSIPEFIEKGHGVVAFAHSPDGLPLLVRVNAPPKAADLLGSVASAFGVSRSTPRLTGTPLETLAEQLDRLLEGQHVKRLDTPGRESAGVIVVPESIQSVGGVSLLSRLLLGSVTSAADLRAATDTRPRAPLTSTMADSAAPVPKAAFVSGGLHPALSVLGDRPSVVRRGSDEFGWPRYSFVRDYIEESVSHLPDAILETYVYDGGTWTPHRVDAEALDHYAELRSQNVEATWTVRVRRNGIARLLLELVDAVARLHDRSEVHADLKPSNVLVGRDGIEVIDSLRLEPGERAPAMTRGWAAPEQVLGQPIRLQTDQYALGHMLLELVGGVPYGEEARVVIPVGGTRLETHTVLRNPGVYIDPSTSYVARGAVDGWLDLIEPCMRFEPETRHESLQLLAERLRHLVELESLSGEVAVPLAFGSCRAGRTSDGRIGACWLAN